MAVDGKNAVVLVQEGDMKRGNTLHVIFHSLEAIVGWLLVDTFLIDNKGNEDYY